MFEIIAAEKTEDGLAIAVKYKPEIENLQSPGFTVCLSNEQLVEVGPADEMLHQAYKFLTTIMAEAIYNEEVIPIQESLRGKSWRDIERLKLPDDASEKTRDAWGQYLESLRSGSETVEA